MKWLHGVLSLDGTLDSKGRERRTQFFIVVNVGWFSTVAYFLSTAAMQMNHPFLLVGSSLAVIGFSIAICAVLCRVHLTTRLVVGTLYLVTCGMFLWDLNSRTVSSSQWPLLVLIIDMLLVMQVPRIYSLGLVGFLVIWLVVLGVEESFRFGLFDLPGLPLQKGEFSREYFKEREYGCDVVPCPKPFPPSTLIPAVAVFVIDFIVTRGFAHEVLAEQASMERTINVVQEIAALLAGYDVESVARMLEEHRDELPQGMIVALRTLEENLRMYKAYLPQTCLHYDSGDDEASTEPTPTNPTLAVVIEAPAFVEACLSPLRSPGTRSGMSPLIGLSQARVTLLTLNIKSTLRLLEEDSATFTQLFSQVLLKMLQMTESYRGMVDVFVGDRVHCSFNASRQCANHATSALHVAAGTVGSSSETSQVNIGVASGTVMRGDMGCDLMRRFSMVGTLMRDVCGMERAGRILGCDVLCNRLCFSEAECEHDLRLIPCKVEVDTGCEPEVVAELLAKVEDADMATSDEWMYTVGGKKNWEDYNTVVRSYFRGDASPDDVLAASAKRKCSLHPLIVYPAAVKGDVLQLSMTLHSTGLSSCDDI